MNRKWQKSTPLENIGMAMRHYHLMGNEWGKEHEYNKVLVSAEYKVQQDFPVE